MNDPTEEASSGSEGTIEEIVGQMQIEDGFSDAAADAIIEVVTQEFYGLNNE